MSMYKIGLLAACLSVAPAPGQAQDFNVPPYHGPYEPQGVDERGVWMLADEAERLLRDQDVVIRDPELNAYIRTVFCRTVGEERCRSVRIYLLRVPYANASMYPNGTMTINSGLLLRARNEAELGAILGHEFAHFERRHTVRGFRRARTASDIVAWATVASAISNRPDYSSVYALGALYEFNRDQEREADILGLGYLKRANYRPRSAADVWKSMMSEVDATAVARGQRLRRYDRASFFATHPTAAERAEYLGQLAGQDDAGRDTGAVSYAAALNSWLPQFLDDQVRLNDFGGTEFILEHLADGDWTADLLFARGELYRTRGNPRDLVFAADFYRQSLQLDGSRGTAYRGLGLSLLRQHSVDEGRAALSRYLELEPNATDAAMIRTLIGQGS